MISFVLTTRLVHGVVWCGWLLGVFLHHTYKVWFSLILERTSLVDGRNQSTKGAVHHISLVQLIPYFLKN